MDIHAIINPASGSVPADGEAALAAALEELGHEAQIAMVEPDNLVGQAQEIAEQQTDLIIAWGGDGSCAATLQAVADTGVPVLVLPGGTMNVLHRQVHGEVLDWNVCLRRALTAGETRPLVAGRANDRLFYVMTIVGHVAGLAAPRELLREGKGIKALQQLTEKPILDVEPALSLQSSNQHDKALNDDVSCVFISLSDYLPDAFEIAVLKPESPAGLVGQSIGMAVSSLLDREDSERHYAERLTVTPLVDGGVDVTFDGEPSRLHEKTVVSFIPDAATVLAIPHD